MIQAVANSFSSQPLTSVQEVSLELIELFEILC